MNKLIYALFMQISVVILLLSQAVNATKNQESKYLLNIEDRPQYVKDNINLAFERLSARTTINHEWVTFGNYDYPLLSTGGDWPTIKPFLLDLISEGEKTINLIDIGAGNFTWGRMMALNLNDLLANNVDEVKINIIGLTGESYEGAPIIETGKCTLHEFGSFKIEELDSELKKRNLDLSNAVHLIVSNWTFLHLTDPLGTLQLAVNLLKPNKGILINQWADFSCKYENNDYWENIDSEKSAAYFYKALTSEDMVSKISILFLPGKQSYVIKKNSSEEINFPFMHDSTSHMVENGAGSSSRISPNPHYIIKDEGENRESRAFRRFSFHGSKLLFDKLLEYNSDFFNGRTHLKGNDELK